jgi:tRNA nucleotidyltransferase (CCA-adding enzyme)
MRLTFHPDLEIRLREVGRAAADVGVEAFVVGGVVRDALRGHENKDVDITVVGDAHRLHQRFAEEWSGSGSVYPEFGTATMEDADGFRVDFVTARTETYARPGALPTIRPGHLREDLARRDFAVNAIAAALAEDSFGSVVDPFHGREDLVADRLRVLHSRSFNDDPTRLFRAARYCVRLGLEPDDATDEAARNAVQHGALRSISGDRRRREVELICAEPRWVEMLAWLSRWGVWTSLSEDYEPRPGALHKADTAWHWMNRNTLEALPPLPMARWLAVLHDAPADVRRALKARPSECTILERAAAATLSLTEPEGPPWYRTMDSRPPAALVLALAGSANDAEKIRLTRYIADIRPKALAINGHDLRRAGVRPGPAMRTALDRTLDAVRTGLLLERPEQLEFATRVALEEGAAGD